MPRKKIERTPEEENEYLQHCREKRKQYQRRYYEKKRILSQKINNASLTQHNVTFDDNNVMNIRSFPSSTVVNEIDHTITSLTQKIVPSADNVTIGITSSSSITNNDNETDKEIPLAQNIVTLADNVVNVGLQQYREKRKQIQRSYRERKRIINQNIRSTFIAVNKVSNEIRPTGLLDVLDHTYALPISSASNVTRDYNNDAVNFREDVLLSTLSNNIQEHYIGLMNVSCIKCEAKHFLAEKVTNKGNSFHDCCGHGEVFLDALPDLPHILQSLFDGSHPKSQRFYHRIRYYNNSFSFASFNANLVNFSHRRPGPYCFKIQGQIYYQMNTSLYPASNENPTYGQLFIVDANESMEYRFLNQNSELDHEIISILETIMRECNIFAQSYQMMKDEIEQQQRLAIQNNTQLPELQLLFHLKPSVDHRRYNSQRINEVAAVFSTTADGEIPDSYVVIRNKNTKVLQSISIMDPNVEPWIYPLFYPYGTRGWHPNLMRVNSSRPRRITRAAYVKYRMAIRSDFNVILMGRRLFQQWVVDNYVRIEKDRIDYIKYNQNQIRSETYQGLVDYLENTAHVNNARIGKMIILPSTFIGSPRNMQQHYQDSMAIVRTFGKPDLFITMTCNPKWREIEENLLDGQEPADRPDICARVFNIKKNYLIDVITKQKFFGDIAAYVYVIEFQKRGLPHVHILVTLKRQYKMITPQMVDRYISAEIPNSDNNPTLHNIIMKNMIHGPCGDWCFKDGKCSKRYPKKFHQETTMDENGYPSYRRKEDGRTFVRPGNYIVDNRHVVPYCPELSLLFNCHINVEVVSSIKSVKYLYKYIYKGHDAANINIGQFSEDAVIDHDEIRDYIEARYVGPVEACWRILSKPLQEKSHTIIRLPVHLPNEHNITIPEHFDENVLETALSQVTMLIDYFALNARDENARHFSYGEIPAHYVFKKDPITKISRWITRKRQFNCIGRMYAISPTQVELFHLRILLLTIKGATSFEHIKTVNGEVLQTFTAACLALGLIEDDDEWKRAMHEAEIWMMPRRFRRLFVRILIHCQPIHPEELWEEFKEALSEDYARYIDPIIAQKKAYAQIASMLQDEGSNLNQFPSMKQEVEFLSDDNECDNNEDMSFEQSKELGKRQYEQLNETQKEIVSIILKAVNDKEYSGNTCFYIDGPGGSGKTFIYTTLYHLLKSENKNICTTAFTGIAATLLPKGKTVHKTFGLPVPLFADSSSNIKIQSKEAKRLKNTNLFIWDEAPMAPRYAMEIIHRLLCDIIGNDLPFGGKIFILGGDFRQLLPIKVHGTQSEIINLSIKNSVLWPVFVQFKLTRNMRTLPEEIEFAQYLLDIGNGTLNDANDNIILPKHCIINANTNLVNEIYGNFLMNTYNYEEAIHSAILSARHSDVEEINKTVIELLNTEEQIYTSIDSTENCDNGDLSFDLIPEYLNTLNPPNFPPHKLHLKINSIVLLLRNLSINEGLCNGTRLLVLKFANNVLQCKILTGDKSGDIVFLNRITLYCENIYPFTFKRRQFPIKVAFAMTINKSQGQTFNKVGIDLRRDVFNHGQIYVAFSRTRSWKNLRISIDAKKTDFSVKNYVYKELYAL